MATHTFPALDTNNVWTGTNNFEGATTFAELNSIFYVDGITYTTVQAAINALPSTGGTVYIPPGSYVGPTIIPSNTALVSLGPQSDTNISGSFAISYGSPHTQVTFTYSAGLNLTNIQNIYIKGITFDFQNTGGLTLTSSSFCIFEHVSLIHAGSGTGAALQITTSGSSGTNNAIENIFSDFSIACNQTTTPTVTGILLGAGTGTTAVTLNRFDRVIITGFPNYGIDIELNSDTNYFHDVTVNNDSGTAGTSVLVFNKTTPGSDIDANACLFENISQTGSFSHFLNAGQSTGNVIVGPNDILNTAVVLGGTPTYTIETAGYSGGYNQYIVGGKITCTAAPATNASAAGSVPGDITALRTATSGVLFLGGDGSQIFKSGSPAVFDFAGAGGTVPGAITLGGTVTPTASANSIGLAGVVGFGNGAAGTAVTTTLKSTGSGPTNPQTIVNYLQINVAGTNYWIPLVQ